MTRSTNHPGYAAFLQLLREERQSLDVTQTELAKRLGNRQTFISKIENGERRLDVVELLEYLDGIGSNAPDFLARLMKRIGGAARKDGKLAVRASTQRRGRLR
jgi:transcriptional regulator with XRE-family HTH domain